MRDVIEQYSQGNMDLMIRLKELQRRMDQILGVPKMNDRDRAKFTVNARLTRLEENVVSMNLKLDDCLTFLKMLPEVKARLELQAASQLPQLMPS